MSHAFPPGPRLPRIVQTIRYARERRRFLLAMSHRYGEVFTLRMTPPFGRRTVVFSRPDHIREIFAADPADMHAGAGRGLLATVMGEHSLLTTDGGEHARARRLLMPAFTASALRGYRDMIETIAKAHVDSWQPGTTLRMLEPMNDVTLEIIMRVVFGVTDDARRAELTALVRRLVQLDPIVLLGWKSARLRRFGPWRRFGELQAALDEQIYAQIARHRAHSDPDRHGDVLTRLLAVGAGESPDDVPLSDTELRDQLITLLLAGHETTATALSWTLHELAAAPEIQERARRAAGEGDDKYLEAVFKEGMRRRTVVNSLSRRLTRDMTVGGHELPEGTVVVAAAVLVHENPEHHPEPDLFRPERFLDGSVQPQLWLPFGGGVRRCIGAGFAFTEGIAVLREVLSRYTLSLPPGVTGEQFGTRNIMNSPRHGAPVVLTALPVAARTPA
ncbi:cytochrome P450 [Nocardia sp. CDC159]|uniref:Cytochrome P450 n=1 Tax=Nocardia pulmonis TaxID=2951408 RepID=A0A9X2IV68_9NOCA|nr:MULTISPECIES: cytochrome P450 [Nocardia]MCM6773587.1 cytochrome P450 [Nocardia pulmonis]MCM6786474.1 cytochrome P450 [Nocardia sp. CDC159]